MIKYLNQGWLVLLLALIFGLALAGIFVWLTPKIEQNQKNETYNQIPNLVPGAAKDKTKEVQIGEIKAYKIFDEADKHIGWVIPASGMGYADTIKALLGLDAKATTITGIYVLEQKETPGLGSKIASPWNEQYDGKKTFPPLIVVKNKPTKENEIQAISGATISSNSLTGIVNQSVKDFVATLAAEASKDTGKPESK